ncbi:piggyBac transposable element-derived protein 4-like [Lepeophtheirus salmonis]|uniref:piggyBac transposable element-derived protein 4-like n=1 Tax=Lepeophtheirus salmonis TaxID=72036 RepID=UPI001AE37DBF|nr:piggyBac transposable element-derived protein 4-like isoform X1 [Lepeophtheirus salmonis]
MPGCNQVTQLPSLYKHKSTNLLEESMYVGKDNTIWHKQIGNGEISARFSQENILKEVSGPSSFAKRNIITDKTLSAFELLIDNYIIDHIVKCTIVEARSKLKNDVWTTSKREILQLIAIMYARGILAKEQPTEVIWSRKLGINLFRNTIPRDRYKELLRYIRFDIRSTRSQRLQNDKFALISMVWDRFVENCKSSYRPGENITIDEQLFPTKARYPFTQYMAKKPDKFGIKFWLAVDASFKYLVNGFPYLGKYSQRPSNKSLSEYVVMKLMEPYLGKGRNVTTDNFFTSLSLANKLQKNRTTILGTMNRARKEIPPELKATKQALF